jgi:hypothetical protein
VHNGDGIFDGDDKGYSVLALDLVTRPSHITEKVRRAHAIYFSALPRFVTFTQL